MEFARGVEKQIGARPELLALLPQYEHSGHARKGEEAQGGVAEAGIFTAERAPPFKEPLGIIAILLGKLIQGQDMGTGGEDLASLQVRRPDQFAGRGDLPCTRKIPEDRQLRKISEPAQQGR